MQKSWQLLGSGEVREESQITSRPSSGDLGGWCSHSQPQAEIKIPERRHIPMVSTSDFCGCLFAGLCLVNQAWTMTSTSFPLFLPTPFSISCRILYLAIGVSRRIFNLPVCSLIHPIPSSTYNKPTHCLSTHSNEQNRQMTVFLKPIYSSFFHHHINSYVFLFSPLKYFFIVAE